MIIVALSDIHGQVGFLTDQSPIVADLSGADVVVISGDITNFGGVSETANVISTLRRYNSNVFAVPGNCDSTETDEYLRSEKINLNCNFVQIESFAFAGVGGSMPCPRKVQDAGEMPDPAVCFEHISKLAPRDMKMVFVCHYPPAGTCVDLRDSGRHAGSEYVRDFIIEHQPILAVTGHVHEAVGVGRLGDTTLVNPGSLAQGNYAVISISDKVDSVELKQL
jgi:Icc-related predicted phosphoesterase